MTFQEQINIYIEKLPCTSKELSAASELSAAVISRYRSGEREPASDSEQLQKLAAGITRLAAERNISDLTDAEEVLSALQNSLEQRNVEYDNFVANFNTLITELDINMKVLASAPIMIPPICTASVPVNGIQMIWAASVTISAALLRPATTARPTKQRFPDCWAVQPMSCRQMPIICPT